MSENSTPNAMAAKLAEMKAKQAEIDRIAEEKRVDAEKAAAERKAKAEAKVKAEKAVIAAALESRETPLTIGAYADLPEVKGVLSETSVKTVLDRLAAEYELDASLIYAGKARTGKWNGNFARSATMYQLGLEAVGAAPATFNQNLYRLKSGDTPGDLRPKAEQTAEWERHDAVAKAIPAKAWERVVKALDDAYAAGEKIVDAAAPVSEEAAAA